MLNSTAYNAVRLFQSKNCDGVSWRTGNRGTAREVAIDPVTTISPDFPDGANQRPTGRAMLDQAPAGRYWPAADAGRSGVTPETAELSPVQGTGLGPKRVDMWIGLFDTVVIGNESINHAHIYFGDLYRGPPRVDRQSSRSAEKSNRCCLRRGLPSRTSRALPHSQRKMYYLIRGAVFVPPPRPLQSDAEPLTNKDTPPENSDK
jgi:hypothetical protein